MEWMKVPFFASHASTILMPGEAIMPVDCNSAGGWITDDVSCPADLLIIHSLPFDVGDAPDDGTSVSS